MKRHWLDVNMYWDGPWQFLGCMITLFVILMLAFIGFVVVMDRVL